MEERVKQKFKDPVGLDECQQICTIFLASVSGYFELNGENIGDNPEQTYDDILGILKRCHQSRNISIAKEWFETSSEKLIQIIASYGRENCLAYLMLDLMGYCYECSQERKNSSGSKILKEEKKYHSINKGVDQVKELEIEFEQIRVEIQLGIEAIKAQYFQTESWKTRKQQRKNVLQAQHPKNHSPTTYSDSDTSPSTSPNLARSLSPKDFFFSDSDDDINGETKLLLAKYFTSKEKGAPPELVMADFVDNLPFTTGLTQQMVQKMKAITKVKSVDGMISFTPIEDKPVTVYCTSALLSQSASLYFQDLRDLQSNAKPRARTMEESRSIDMNDPSKFRSQSNFA